MHQSQIAKNPNVLSSEGCPREGHFFKPVILYHVTKPRGHRVKTRLSIFLSVALSNDLSLYFHPITILCSSRKCCHWLKYLQKVKISSQCLTTVGRKGNQMVSAEESSNSSIKMRRKYEKRKSHVQNTFIGFFVLEIRAFVALLMR